MNVSFNCISFQLQFSSDQINTVYSLLDLNGREDYIIPVYMLKNLKVNSLPQKFKEWVEQASEDVSIIFEQRMISTQTESFKDWELIDF